MGLGLVAFFGGRKLLQHPDVRGDISERSVGETTPATFENSARFRQTTSAFSGLLGTLANAWHTLSFGSTRPRTDHFWDVSRYSEPVPAPLEHTSYFEDGLFKTVAASPAPTGVMHAADDKEDLE